MKHLRIEVEFKDPEKEIKEQLQRQGARNVSLKRQYDGTLEVKYELKCPDPKKDIQKLLERMRVPRVDISSTYDGARFEFGIDDKLDEREFKRALMDAIRRMGYRSY